MNKSALLLGATGLIGRHLLQLLLADNYYISITAITRRPISPHSKLVNLIGSYDDVDELLKGKSFDDVYCCLGTTMKKAGSKEDFRKVDYDYPLRVAELAKKEGAKQFVVISAMGANPESSVFYNHVKGEVERDLRAIEFESLHIFRPALLLGPRDEKRLGEKLGQVVFKVLNFLFVGPLQKYRAIDYRKVAQAMLAIGKEHSSGTTVHLSDELQQY